MVLLVWLSYVAAVIMFLFATISLGLIWVAEIIEEHSRAAKLFGIRAIYTIIVLHVLLCVVDSLPLYLTLFSIACHLVYYQNFSSLWPFIALKSWTFIGSCVLVVVDHFAWFHYFGSVLEKGRRKANSVYRPHDEPVGPGFLEIASFFGICIWLVPVFLFLSLSANDNALPIISRGDASIPLTPQLDSAVNRKLSRSSLFKSAYDGLFDLLPLESFPRFRSGRRRSDGLIATHPAVTVARSPRSSPHLKYQNLPESPPSGGSWTFADLPPSRTPRQRVPSDLNLAPPPLRRSASDAISLSRRSSGTFDDEGVFMSPRLRSTRPDEQPPTPSPLS